jgi:hypothetical protein
MCGCGKRKAGETVVWRTQCAGQDPQDFLTEIEAKAAVSICKSGKGTYTRTAVRKKQRA